MWGIRSKKRTTEPKRSMMGALSMYASLRELNHREFESTEGKSITIFELSNIYEDGIIVADGSISIDEQRLMGRVAIVESSSQLRSSKYAIDQNIILLISLNNNSIACRIDGSLIPTITISLPDDFVERFNSLIEGSQSYGCVPYIASIPRLKFTSHFTRLLVERIELKCAEQDQHLNDTDFNWSESFYITLMKMIGMGANQKTYIRLARRIPYKMICREKHSPKGVEALLLGSAGFLDDPIDPYQRELHKEFTHLQAKYGLIPLRRSEWDSKSRTRPTSHPVLRLAQIASLLCSKDLLFDSVMKCKSVEDINRIFDTIPSKYWDTHYTFDIATAEQVKRFSRDTLNVIGINVVCMSMFRYSKYTQNDELQNRAFDLLDKLYAEKNSIIKKFLDGGVEIENASFSQAILQLHKIYCTKKSCGSCFVGKARMKSE